MGEHEPLLSADDVERLREALTSANYTSTGIGARIGPDAVDAVRRNDFRALLRATADSGRAPKKAPTSAPTNAPTTAPPNAPTTAPPNAPGHLLNNTSATDPAAQRADPRDRLATLIRIFLAGQTEPVEAVAAALAPLSLDSAIHAGLVEAYGDGLHAGLDLDVYGDPARGVDWWVLSDLDADARPGPLRTDHVLGVGNAATTLAQATIRRAVDSALDLGTGCGVQALHLATHARSVTATDLSARALRFAATTAALNGMAWELLAGDMAAPVAGRRFDLVVSNPPFVVGPGAARYTYRDSGRAGDAICAELAAAAPDLLAEGGTLQFLANWLHIRGEDWRERVAGWVAPTGCDAWIIQRELTDPVEYVNLWLRDAAEVFDPQRAQAWLDWFDANKIEAVGFGLVTMVRAGRDNPVVRAEELRQSVEAPLGTQVREWFARQDWLAAHPDPLAVRYRRAPGLRLTQEAEHDGDDWAVGRQLLTLTGGLRWAEEVDPVALALVSGADGSVSMREQLDVLASAFDTPAPLLAAMAVPVVAHLVERGILLPD